MTCVSIVFTVLKYVQYSWMIFHAVYKYAHLLNDVLKNIIYIYFSISVAQVITQYHTRNELV